MVTVFTHEPNAYNCPFCAFLAGRESAWNSQRDIVRRTELATAFISPEWWPHHHGNVLVVANAHHENLYGLPAIYGHAVHDLVQQVATAIRSTYECDGTTIRQHNEPAGGQEVWHYHAHVFPRHNGYDLYGTAPYADYISAERRWAYADRLRAYFDHDA